MTVETNFYVMQNLKFINIQSLFKQFLDLSCYKPKNVLS